MMRASQNWNKQLKVCLSHGELRRQVLEVSERGGRGIPAFVDHSNMVEVKTFFEMIEKDNNGQLDILVNNAYSAVKVGGSLLIRKSNNCGSRT